MFIKNITIETFISIDGQPFAPEGIQQCQQTTINVIVIYIGDNKISIMQDSCPVCCRINLRLYRILTCKFQTHINFHVLEKRCFSIKASSTLANVNQKSIETSIAEMSHEFSVLESCVNERVNPPKSEFHNFKRRALASHYDEEYISTLKKSNEAFKEKVANLTYLLSDLTREIRHVEEESIVTAIKILQQDHYDANDSSDQLNYEGDKSTGHNFNKVLSKWVKKANITTNNSGNN